ncbi:MAG TPA: hypothetical protein PKY59_06170 [Pyrinomonadaceae bacterium]|nr:hypothetical protein [Pyrinomonadaceae bacterium]
MKKFCLFIIGVLLFIVLNFEGITAQTVSKETLPNLRGEDAIKQLQETGQYESLKKAVKTAREKDGQTESPTNELIIGLSQNLTAADGATGDNLGKSVAVSGNTAVVGANLDDVGANNNQGSAYVFVRSGEFWSLQQKLTASDGAANDSFGWSVAISGDTIVVGAYEATVGGITFKGSAYVFVRSGTTWSQQQKLTASDGEGGDNFGSCVSISGDTILVGAYFDRVGVNNTQGSAYVFVRSGTVWTEQQKLTAADGAEGDNFGWNVAINGNTAVIGAPFSDAGENSDQGAGYVFVRSGTVWTLQQKLTASDGAQFDYFGFSVAISGETVVVGAYLADVGSVVDNGAAYVFVRSGTVWSQQKKLSEPDHSYGSSVAISGDEIIVGAVGDFFVSNSTQGRAYVYARTGPIWILDKKLFDPNDVEGDNFGTAVGISESNLIVGAFGVDSGKGAAYAYSLSGGKWRQESQEVATDGAANDLFGRSVAISGNTAVISSHFDQNGANLRTGSAYVFVRNGADWVQQQKLTASDGADGDNFSWSVDIDGETIVIGAPRDGIGSNANQGSAYVFVRSGTTWSQQQKLTASDGAANDEFGFNVGVSGDTIVVGAWQDSSPLFGQGSAYVFVRSGATWSQQQKLTASDGLGGDNFGNSVGISGDTIIVGAFEDKIGTNFSQGSAYVFVRNGSVWTQQDKLTANEGGAGDRFGFSVAIDGDKVVIGAANDTIGSNASQGSAYVFVRSGGFWTQAQKLIASDGSQFDMFGTGVGISGDTIVVGAFQDSIVGNNIEGSAYVFTFTGVIFYQDQKLFALNSTIAEEFGYSVAVSGNKIVVGAAYSSPTPLSENGKSDLVPSASAQGRAYFFTNASLIPTAAKVSIGGRVLTNTGAGLVNATVSLTKSNGEIVTTRTSSFGNFRFDDIDAGQTVIFTVNSKRFSFASQVVNLSYNTTDLELRALN